MKKISCVFGGCLLFGIVLCNAIINILTYNLWYKSNVINSIRLNFDSDFIILAILSIIFVIISVSVNVLSMCLFNKITKKCIEVSNDEKQNDKFKKFSKIFVIINILLYSLLIIKWFTEISQYNSDYLHYMDSIENTIMGNAHLIIDALIPIYTGIVNVLIIIFFILFNLIAIIPIKNVFKENKGNLNTIAKVLTNTSLSIFVIVGIIINIYYYVDIPEFNYLYDFIGEDYAVIVKEYSDIRKLLRGNEYIVPEKIWNKNVVSIDSEFTLHFSYPNLKIVIPSNFNWNLLTTSEIDNMFYKIDSVNNKIEMKGAPKTWFIENSVAYNKDKTEAYIFNSSRSEDNYIPTTVKNIYSNISNLELNGYNILVDKDNPYYYSYDNAIYTKEALYDEEEVVFWGQRKQKGKDEWGDCQICCLTDTRIQKENLKLPSNIDSYLFILGSINKVTIPKELHDNNLMIRGDINDFEIEYGNAFYSLEEGCLLSKDKTRLISLSKKSYRNNEYYISETIKEINEKILEYYKDSTFNVSKNNPYIEKIENGVITYKEYSSAS